MERSERNDCRCAMAAMHENTDEVCVGVPEYDRKGRCCECGHARECHDRADARRMADHPKLFEE